MGQVRRRTFRVPCNGSRKQLIRSLLRRAHPDLMRAALKCLRPTIQGLRLMLLKSAKSDRALLYQGLHSLR